VDLCVDIPGVPVDWFWQHVTVKYKRTHMGIGSEDLAKRRKGGCSYPSFTYETLYYGRRNLFRFYDKTAQLEELARKNQINQSDLQLLEAYTANASCWTRVERQCLDRMVPKQLGTLTGIFEHALAFDPFESFEIRGGGKPLPSEQDCKFNRYMKGLGMRTYLENHSLQELRAFANISGGHAKKYLNKFKDFLPEDPNGFEPPDLLELYKRALRSQLGEFLLGVTDLAPVPPKATSGLASSWIQ
jgi:hypothetical protein